MALKTGPMVEELELLGCIQCGKCTGGCPVARKTVLNIRSLIYHMLVEPDLDLGAHQELWDCTCCFTCVERCPKDVQPAELIIGLRGQLVERGRIPDTIGAALMGIFRQGNPTGIAREDRAAWADGIGVKSAQEGTGAGHPCDVLYFVGCIPAYDVRVQRVPRALVRAFTAAGVDFGTLGTEESCCGNEVRRVGEVGLFEMLVEENSELVRSVGASRLVTTSPHCFNTFKNEYGFGDVAYDRTSFAVREEGKEWVGTAAALWGITAGVYLALMGPQGMAEIGEGIMARARYAVVRMAEIPGVRAPAFDAPHFQEFVVSFEGTGRTVADINEALQEKGILGGRDLSQEFPALGQSALYCVSEIHSQDDIEQLVTALEEVVEE